MLREAGKRQQIEVGVWSRELITRNSWALVLQSSQHPPKHNYNHNHNHEPRLSSSLRSTLEPDCRPMTISRYAQALGAPISAD
ncbi:MAG: hypothetical protein CL912_33235 [Deltaproteobacteria bacterium]|nr:hypothetical protein [Deltaproteobacteria bacterium]